MAFSSVLITITILSVVSTPSYVLHKLSLTSSRLVYVSIAFRLAGKVSAETYPCLTIAFARCVLQGDNIPFAVSCPFCLLSPV